MDLICMYLFIFATIFHGVHGLNCLSCHGVVEPRSCIRKHKCDVGEICYTEQVIGDDLTNYYNVGCRSKQLCDMAKVAFGRRSGELQVCQKCCNTDNCNNQACRNSQSASANICSRCQDIASPLECPSIVECRSDEVCFTQQFVNANLEKRYNLGCEKKKRCDLLRQLAPHHRSLQLCNECCQGLECNKQLCSDTVTKLSTKPTSRPTNSTTTLTSSASPTNATLYTNVNSPTTLTTTTTAIPTPSTKQYKTTYSSTILTTTQATTKVQAVVNSGSRTCFVCGDAIFPCNIYYIGIPQTCKNGDNYCMTDIIKDAAGYVDIYKRCVDLATCEKKWLIESADKDYCKPYQRNSGVYDISCHYCCTEDKCNSMLVPNVTTWYSHNRN